MTLFLAPKLPLVNFLAAPVTFLTTVIPNALVAKMDPIPVHIAANPVIHLQLQSQPLFNLSLLRLFLLTKLQPNLVQVHLALPIKPQPNLVLLHLAQPLNPLKQLHFWSLLKKEELTEFAFKQEIKKWPRTCWMSKYAVEKKNMSKVSRKCAKFCLDNTRIYKDLEF